MKTLLAKLKTLWSKEPVLVSSLLPVAVTLGVLSQSQASTLTNAITGVVSVIAELGAAWKLRSVVTSPDTAKALKAKATAALTAAARGVTASSNLGSVTAAVQTMTAVGESAAKAADEVAAQIKDLGAK